MEQRELSEACCRIRSSGTGFLVARDRVATCFHAVADLAIGDDVTLVFYGGATRTGQLLAVDVKNDGAILAIAPLEGVEALPLAEAYDGRETWEGCGFPDEAEGLAIPLSGVVEAPGWKCGAPEDMLVLRCNQAGGAPVVGWSGSPVVVSEVVVGFVNGYCRDKAYENRPAFGDLFATPARVLRHLLPGLPPAPGLLFGYLRHLERSTSFIELQGISSGAGESRAATRSRIERMYTPLRARGPQGRESGLMESRKVHLADLLPHHPRLLFVGAPGSGKTTFLRLVACMLARDALGRQGPGGKSWRAAQLGLAGAGRAPVPLFIRLADLAHDLEGRAERDVQAAALLHAVAPDSDLARREPERRAMERALLDGDAMLLLDGLDEVTNEGARRRVLAIIEEARQRWPSASIVATSRPFETQRLMERGLDFEAAFVEAFEREEIRAFLDRWVSALPGVDAGYRELLEDAIIHRGEIRRLAENPVMLTCLCVVHWNERALPNGRGAAYRAVIKWLLLARNDQRAAAGFSQGFAERALPELALCMMRHPAGKQASLGIAEAATAVEPVALAHRKKLREGDAPRQAAEQWLRWECTGSGVLQQVGHGTLHFWHLTFQEFLAAERLAEESAETWWSVIQPRLDDPQWTMLIDLFPTSLLKRGDGMVAVLLEHILALRAPKPVSWLARVLGRARKPTLADDAAVVALLYRMLVQLDEHEYPVPAAIEAAYYELLRRVRAIFELEGARQVPWRDRLAAATALGSAGDFRLEGSPLDRMLEVPGRNGLLQGKYPVTVQEYAEFVRDGGYEAERYWVVEKDREGWERREAETWTEPGEWKAQQRTPNRPVVGVSWFEATAYCAWLSERSGKGVRLPTSYEWTAAATNSRGPYPWGKEAPTEEHANFGNTVDAPTPVGVYPRGASPGGHLDMAGNVWEWTSTKVSTEYQEAPDDTPLERAPFRGLRGGACSYEAEYLHSVSCSAEHADKRYGYVGFRLALSPASLGD